MTTQVKCCATCMHSYDREGSTVLWCKLKGDMAPTWYCCSKHELKEYCEENYKDRGSAA